MSYYEFPHTRNYEQDLSFFVWIANHLKKRIEKLEERCTLLEERMKTAEENIVDLQTRMATAENDIIELKKRITDAETNIRKLNEELSKLTDEFRSLQSSYLKFVDEFNEWKTEIENDITNINNEITEIKTDISTIESNIENINNTITNINNIIGKLEEKDSEIETRLTKLENDIFHFADKKSTGLIYFIDQINGSDSNTGLSNDNAFQTLDHAIEVALINDFKVTFNLIGSSTKKLRYFTSYRNFANVTITFKGDDSNHIFLTFGEETETGLIRHRVNFYNCVAQFYNLDIEFNNAHHNNCSIIYSSCSISGYNADRMDNNFLIETSQMYFRDNNAVHYKGVNILGTNRIAVLNSSLVAEEIYDERDDVSGSIEHGYNQGGIYRVENGEIIFKKGKIAFSENPEIENWNDLIEGFWSKIGFYTDKIAIGTNTPEADFVLINTYGNHVINLVRGERNIVTVGSDAKTALLTFVDNIVANNADEMPGEVVSVSYE